MGLCANDRPHGIGTVLASFPVEVPMNPFTIALAPVALATAVLGVNA